MMNVVLVFVFLKLVMSGGGCVAGWGGVGRGVMEWGVVEWGGVGWGVGFVRVVGDC